jgi:hypothetical protein
MRALRNILLLMFFTWLYLFAVGPTTEDRNPQQSPGVTSATPNKMAAPTKPAPPVSTRMDECEFQPPPAPAIDAGGRQWADRARARDMFSYAATNFGDADAQYELGRLYLTGTPSDPHQAARWLRLAATKGHCRAEVALGDLLFQGQVVPRQAARGLMWLTLSRDCAGADATWVKPLYDRAFKCASADERALAFVYLEDWLKGRRD